MRVADLSIGTKVAKPFKGIEALIHQKSANGEKEKKGADRDCPTAKEL
jgi:hypothetical protein